MTQFLANGLCSGGAFALIALGFGLILFAARTFHIAHGAVIATAAVCAHISFADFGLPLPVAIGFGLLAGTLLGVAVEKLIYYPLIDPWRHFERKSDVRQPFDASTTIVLISSLGVYVAMANILVLFFGNSTKVFFVGIGSTVEFGGVILSYVQLAQFAVAILACLGLWLALSRTGAGRVVRGMADDPELLCVAGYDLRTIRTKIFAAGSLLASGGGILMALDTGASAHMGFNAVLIAAVATIVGGFGQLFAPALGALLLGLLQGIVVWQASGRWANLALFSTLILMLMLKPDGLVPQRGKRL